MNMNIVLIGAGSAQFGLGTLGDVFQSEILKNSHITLVDINQKALDVVYQKGVNFLAKNSLPFTISQTTERTKALLDADVVIISIEVGDRFALWNDDWSIPQQYGVSQVYGENGGVGGIFHALRITPVILAICEDVARLCPQAWVFNYSNPMTAITTAVLRRYPEMKFIGLCHEVLSHERYLPTILETPFDNLFLRSGGLNHFSVLLEARYKDTNMDAYGDILKKAPPFFEKEIGFSDMLEYVLRTGKVPHTEGSTGRTLIDHPYSAKPWADRTLFKTLLETYQLLPITSDSHLGEYISWASDVTDHKGIKDFYTIYQMMLAQEKPEIELHRDERLILIMEGIVTNSGYEEPAVNVMNKGLIPSLPSDIAVEVPARVYRTHMDAIAFPHYPKGFSSLLTNYYGTYDLTAQAILEEKKHLVLQAVLANPVVHSIYHAKEMVEFMISRQLQYLSYLK
ncbi:MAG: alpha-glucosidase [Spirochaetia bacterium]|nr:alpha-glucosidase [Spirochaetia bacterium]